jgi:hypothetical protein
MGRSLPLKSIEIDIGAYNPLLGKSCERRSPGSVAASIAAKGWARLTRRGPAKTNLTLVAGDPATTNVFEGIDTTWNRLPGGSAVGQILGEAARTFLSTDPAKTIPLLLKARPLIVKIADGPARPWAEFKLQELDEAIAACAGLWIDVTADRPAAVPGSTLQATLTAINRSQFP